MGAARFIGRLHRVHDGRSARCSTGTGNGDVEWKWSRKRKSGRGPHHGEHRRDFMRAVYPQDRRGGDRPPDLFDRRTGGAAMRAAGDHVFVVTHVPLRRHWEFADTAPFTFVTDGVEAAERAGLRIRRGSDVDVGAGEIGGQALRLGLMTRS